MISKLLEIRDEGTKISALAIKLGNETSEEENEILRHAGWGDNPKDRWDHRYVLLLQLDGGIREAHNDPFQWRDGSRTMFNAHLFIKDHFDELNTGDIVDVQYLLGETDHPKTR